MEPCLTTRLFVYEHRLIQLSENAVDQTIPSGREQGWRSGESARLPPMWPGFDSRTRRHMWVEFVVSFRPCSEGFSPDTPVFLLLKN